MVGTVDCHGNTFNTGTPFFVANGSPAAPPAPPDPAVVAEAALDILRLRVTPPVMHFGPDPDRIAVNFPVWLWADQQPELVETSTVLGVSVTARAVMGKVTWQMGEPVDPANPLVLAPAVECPDAGDAPDGSVDLRNPPCGYTYQWRSLKERTNGAGKWQVTATATWTLTWESNVPDPNGGFVSGSDTLPSRSTTTVDVGEYSSVIVYGG